MKSLLHGSGDLDHVVPPLVPPSYGHVWWCPQWRLAQQGQLLTVAGQAAQRRSFLGSSCSSFCTVKCEIFVFYKALPAGILLAESTLYLSAYSFSTWHEHPLTPPAACLAHVTRKNIQSGQCCTEVTVPCFLKKSQISSGAVHS